MDKWISVIIPVYNAENYLDNCIASVREQTFDNWEIILVDDGSTDKSSVICDTWALEDERIRVIHTENQGAAAARNTGIKYATGLYVCFIDADDIVDSNYLEYHIELLKEYKADISVCGYRKIYVSNDKLKASDDNSCQCGDISEGSCNCENACKVGKEERICFTGEEAMEDLLYQRHFMSVPWGSVSKRGIWDIVSFPEATKAEDMGTIYRMYGAARRVAYGSSKLYDYYQRSGNTIYSTSSVRNIDYFKHSRRMVNYVSKNNPGIKGSAYSRHFSTCFQILSETGYGKNKKLCRAVYADIRKLQAQVLKDNKASLRNRGAALLSLVAIMPIHVALRCAYIAKKRKMA